MSPEQQLAMRVDFAKLRTQFQQTGWTSGTFTSREEAWGESGLKEVDIVQHCLMGAIGHIWELGGERYEFRDELVSEAVQNEDYGEELEQMILALGTEARKRVVQHHYDLEYTKNFITGDIEPSTYGNEKEEWLETLKGEGFTSQQLAKDYNVAMHTEFIMGYNDNVHGREFAIPSNHVHRAGESYGNEPAKTEPSVIYLSKEDVDSARWGTAVGTHNCSIDCARWIRVDQETAIKDLYKLFDYVESQDMVTV
jgi:hypothetical protein|tara:strand:+ start:2710 stop:3468 length:759 start_codon:yes stop_codon:yes gene_type:complete